MQAIDTRGKFDEEIKNSQKLTDEILNKNCLKEGEKACRYTMLNAEGFFCGKNTKFKTMLDEKVKKNTIIAKGDNCEGIK